MSYTPPFVSVSATWSGEPQYAAPLQRLRATWSSDTSRWVLPPGLRPWRLGTPAVGYGTLYPVVPGWLSQRIGATHVLNDRTANYRPPQWVLHASWKDAPPYTGAAGGFLRGSWDDGLAVIAPAGIAGEAVPQPAVYQARFVLPAGWASEVLGGNVYALHSWQYAAPQWRLDASWVGRPAYAAPTYTVDAAWALPSEAKQVSLVGWDSAHFGTAVLPVLQPSGWDASALPPPNVRNTAAPLRVTGFDASAVGNPVIWNWRQYLPLEGYDAQRFGAAFVSGGVKHVTHAGWASQNIPRPTVINTTADQFINLVNRGILWPGMGQPDVSPRFLRPPGVYGTAPGFPVVQFPPQPLGWHSSTFGYATVEYKTKIARPAGIDAFAAGFPTARDRAQKVLHQASTVTALFGDVLVRVLNQRVAVTGHASAEFGDWSTVYSTSRWLYAPGLSAAQYGGTEIRNRWPSIIPAGIDSLSWGGVHVGARVRHVYPAGVSVPFGQAPSPQLWQTPSLAPLGLAPPAVPPPFVWPAERALFAAGDDMQFLGAATITFRWRALRLEGFGVAGAQYGAAWVSHSARRISLIGRSELQMGWPAWVSRAVRELEPKGIQEPDMHLHQIGGTRYLGPVGFEATRWLTRIVPEAREIYPKSFGAAYGWPSVHHHTRYLPLEGITTYPEPFMHWGVARVWNLRQIITQEEPEESLLRPPKWPQWTLVENRNKVIGAFGFNAGRYTPPAVDNNARLLAPPGIGYPALPEYYKAGSVTHRMRPLPLDGIEAPYISTWAVVHNKAVPLAPHGLVATNFGVAELVNLRRFYRMVGYDAQVFGYPMVADAIREITFESRYGIAPPRVDLPVVHLHTRYIEPPSVLKSQYESGLGVPSLTIYFRRISTRWVHQEWAGEPIVRNRTPELLTRGRAADEWGDAFVRLEWRPIASEGANTALIGLARIADRKQAIAVPGRNFMTVSDKVTVRRIGEAPVATQFIDLRLFTMAPDGGHQVEMATGRGIATPQHQVPVPDLLKGYIFHGHPRPSEDMLLMGKPYVTANSIRVEPGLWGRKFGQPFVSLKDRVVSAMTIGELIRASLDNDYTDMGSWGRPRLSPHTIYAVLEAPSQAMRNHRRRKEELRPVNDGAKFGRAVVTGWRSEVFAKPIHHPDPLGRAGVGRPSLYNRRQFVHPVGTYMGRMGWVTIPGPQNITIEELMGGHKFGRPAVAPPPYVGPVHVGPSGLAAASTGAHAIDFFHRTVRPGGFLSQRMGASGSGSGVNMPQNLHVGPRRPNIAGDILATSYGEPWVSHRVRGVQAEGFDSFASEYDYQNFKHRMRVKRASSGAPMWRLVGHRGHTSSQVGTPGVKPMLHYIRPDGNAEQYRKGAF